MKILTTTFILDTNVYLTEVQALFSFGKADVAIPTIVLDEIDRHKHRQDVAGLNARGHSVKNKNIFIFSLLKNNLKI